MSGDNPYQTADTPAEWGEVVRDYVAQRAERTEELGGREGEYNSTLKDPSLADEFKAHAQQYSRALWQWATADVPPDISEWALGHTPTPVFPATERLGYLLIRRETMGWWSIRGRTDQTPEALRTDAERMMQVTQFLSLASGLKDYELFEHLVKEKRQTRANRRPATIEFYLFQYWLAWSLWQGDHSSNLAVLERRLNLLVSKSSMSKAITRLRLRP